MVAARTAAGAFAAYDLCANEHRDHILDTTQVPAGVSARPRSRPSRSPASIAEALDYVGVLAVEMFLVTEDGGERLVVNEIAPRVHNSGHWTLDGAATSQFEQHVRAVCGWPLGATARLGRVEMGNLIGDDADAWERDPGRAGRASPPLRQGRGPAGPQDGARHAGFSGEGPEPFPKPGPLVSLTGAFLERQAWTGKASSGIDAGQIEVRMTRLICFLPQSKRLKTRNSRAGSCPG